MGSISITLILSYYQINEWIISFYNSPIKFIYLFIFENENENDPQSKLGGQ